MRKGVLRASKFKRKGDFIWLKKQIDITPRVPSFNDRPRPLEYIAEEELAVAMKIIIQGSFGLDKENLFRILSKQYGFARISSSMKAILEKAFEILKTDKEVFISDGKISLI